MSSFSQTYQDLRSSQKFQKRLSMASCSFIALFLIFFAIFPVLWIISASFSGTQSLSTQTLIPAKASLVNYQKAVWHGPNLQVWRPGLPEVDLQFREDFIHLHGSQPGDHDHGGVCLLTHALCRDALPCSKGFC
jgi:hypothetical protein